MSELPPNAPSPSHPQQFVGYTRPGATYGDPERLKALADGYYGLNTVFVVNVLWAVAMGFALAALVVPFGIFGALAFSTVLTGLLIGSLVHPKNKLIAYGANWNPGSARTASILMALNSALCCGILGYMVVQNLAMVEMKKYGLKAGLFGVRRRDVETAMERLRTAKLAPPPPAVPPGV
ncbi:MAG: hypothetical protein QOJ65_1766 [Fimbriimonadaceae bacterium]|jgi:hypothetical protein|nr:hypothetical protein [Fimbriimonadaceae bacterium]